MNTSNASHVACRSHRLEGNPGEFARRSFIRGFAVVVAMSGGAISSACNSQPQYIYVTAGSGAGKGTGGNGAAMKTDAQNAMNEAGTSGGMSKKPASSTQTGAASSSDGGSTASSNGQGGSNGASTATSSGSAGQGGTAPSTISACKDNAGQNACDGNRLYHCLDAGGQEPLGTCTNAMRCTAGIKSGQCGMCDPGDFDCQDALLMMCDDTGTWAMSMQCASAELCSKQNHSCDPMACAKDAYNCMGDELQQCSQDLTSFQTVMMCDAGLCDQKDGKCYECMPNTKSCDGSSLVTCDGDGKKTETACSGNNRYCLKDSCVECMSDTDCMSTSECLPAKCDTSTGMCSIGTPKPLKTACSSNGGKICDLTGNCVTCIDDTDCSPSERCNPLNLITPCEARSPVEAVAGPLGDYTVTIAPGFEADVTNNIGGDLIVDYGTVSCVGGCMFAPTSSAATHNFNSIMPCNSLDRGLLQTGMYTVELKFASTTMQDMSGIIQCDSSKTVTVTAKSTKK